MSVTVEEDTGWVLTLQQEQVLQAVFSWLQQELEAVSQMIRRMMVISSRSQVLCRGQALCTRDQETQRAIDEECSPGRHVDGCW